MRISRVIDRQCQSVQAGVYRCRGVGRTGHGQSVRIRRRLPHESLRTGNPRLTSLATVAARGEAGTVRPTLRAVVHEVEVDRPFMLKPEPLTCCCRYAPG